jgi:hypothetical protein
MSGSTSLTASINTAPTSNSNTGGTLSNSNSYPVSTDPPPAGGDSDKSIYTNCISDLDYYTSNPNLPSQISGNGTATISGSYSVSGGQIKIISSNTVITFSSGIKGTISIPFNNSTISGNGITYTYLSALGLSDQTSTLLPVNITISINNATISNNNLSANITIAFSAAFINLDTSQQQNNSSAIYAPGTILNEPFVGTITGSTGTIRTITLSKNLLTHKLK